MSALELQNVHKTYGNQTTLKGIDISIDSGEFLVLLGASGCGKSTLLNIIAGLTNASQGDVRIQGRSVLGVHPKNRDIAMVFQSYALYPNLSIRRNIGFGLEMRGVAKDDREAAVSEVAKLLQIETLLDRKPGQLSGGQRQRVAIGRALVRKPEVFLFDEPLSNLDAKLRSEMRTELKRLHQMLRTTVVYVTHDQIEAMTLATQVAVMRDGRVEQLGSPEEIYNRPRTLYVAGFVGTPSMNFMKAAIVGENFQILGTDIRYSLPQHLVGRKQEGSDITIGLRPEKAYLGTPEQSVVLDANVEIAELTGPELLVSASVGGQRLVFSAPSNAKASPGMTIRISYQMDDLHFFDPETGLAIRD